MAPIGTFQGWLRFRRFQQGKPLVGSLQLGAGSLELGVEPAAAAAQLQNRLLLLSD